MIIVEISSAKEQSYKHSFGHNVWHLKKGVMLCTSSLFSCTNTGSAFSHHCDVSESGCSRLKKTFTCIYVYAPCYDTHLMYAMNDRAHCACSLSLSFSHIIALCSQKSTAMISLKNLTRNTASWARLLCNNVHTNYACCQTINQDLHQVHLGSCI